MFNNLKAPSIIESAIDEEGYCALEDSLLDMFKGICGEDEENEEKNETNGRTIFRNNCY